MATPIVEGNNFNKQLRGTRFNSLFENVKTSNNSHSGHKIVVRDKICATPHGVWSRDLSEEDTS